MPDDLALLLQQSLQSLYGHTTRRCIVLNGQMRSDTRRLAERHPSGLHPNARKGYVGRARSDGNQQTVH